MAAEEDSTRKLIPDLLYLPCVPTIDDLDTISSCINTRARPAKLIGRGGEKKGGIMLPAQRGIETFSPDFYAACTIGGSLSPGSSAVTPIDLAKSNMQAPTSGGITPAPITETRRA